MRLSGTDADFVVTMTNDEPFQPPTLPARPAAGRRGRGRHDPGDPPAVRAAEGPGRGGGRQAGVSVNAWLIRAISQALDTPPGRERPGRSRAALVSATPALPG